MIMLVLTTIACFLFEVKHEPPLILIIIEDIALVIFILEWLARVWVNGNVHQKIIDEFEHTKFIEVKFRLLPVFQKIWKEKLDFILSPMSIIDLLAILPYYRPLRILRVFMLFRLFKLFRYTSSVSQFASIFKDRKFDFYTLLLMFAMTVFFGASIMYIYEGHGVNENLESFFDALYWAVITVATVGYGDITPVTMEGRIATIFLVMGGFTVIVFGSSIVTSSMMEKLEEVKNDRSFASVAKLNEFSIICSFSSASRILCKELKKENEKFIIIEPKKLSELQLDQDEKEYLFIQGEPSNYEILNRVLTKTNVKNFITLAHEDATNVAIILSAKAINPTLNIISVVNNSQNEPKLKLAGTHITIPVNRISASVGVGYIKHKVAFEAIEEILVGHNGALVIEIEPNPQSIFIGQSLKDVNFKQFKVILLGVINSNGDFIFNPKSDYILKTRDSFVVIGFEYLIGEFRGYINTTKALR